MLQAAWGGHLNDNEALAPKLETIVNSLEKRYSIKKISIVTCDDVHYSKPNPESLLLALSRLGCKPEEAAVMGDHEVDMQAGVNAGVNTRIGLTHGHHNQGQLQAAGATHTVNSLSDVPACLSKLAQ